MDNQQSYSRYVANAFRQMWNGTKQVGRNLKKDLFNVAVATLALLKLVLTAVYTAFMLLVVVLIWLLAIAFLPFGYLLATTRRFFRWLMKN